MRSYPVKENPIGSAVSKILRYKHTNTQRDKQTSCYFSIRIYCLFICNKGIRLKMPGHIYLNLKGKAQKNDRKNLNLLAKMIIF